MRGSVGGDGPRRLGDARLVEALRLGNLDVGVGRVLLQRDQAVRGEEEKFLEAAGHHALAGGAGARGVGQGLVGERLVARVIEGGAQHAEHLLRAHGPADPLFVVGALPAHHVLRPVHRRQLDAVRLTHLFVILRLEAPVVPPVPRLLPHVVVVVVLVELQHRAPLQPALQLELRVREGELLVVRLEQLLHRLLLRVAVPELCVPTVGPLLRAAARPVRRLLLLGRGRGRGVRAAAALPRGRAHRRREEGARLVGPAEVGGLAREDGRREERRRVRAAECTR
eukprot:CAMPEP_0179908114 /NCGR_PEP_ID=MMETSP0982-20121206/44333_1 /TAXON_ID=483367 /ORGANISM="non described non described, Strain CCMP 2436" /LENGTH=281 /DNA_ID=CAMNT_0021809123 /DNA_START=405 /DNA_END=1246 /DNA_ORIENTATION=-